MARTGTDRRTLLTAAVVGAGAVLLGVPPVTAPWEGPGIEIDSAQRVLATLAAQYDAIGPTAVGHQLEGIRERFRTVLPQRRRMTSEQAADVTRTYSQLSVMAATAANGTGDYARGQHLGNIALRHANEVGDQATEAHAYGVLAGSLRSVHRREEALVAAQKGEITATRGPTVVLTLLEEALALAKLPGVNPYSVLECVYEADRQQAALSAEQEGMPSYPLGTYHPALTKLCGATALVQVGLYPEAVPRLEEAGAMLAGSDGLRRASVLMTWAELALATGDVDTALEHATVAVGIANDRPHAAIANRLSRMARHRAHGREFIPLVRRTEEWRLA